MASETLHGSILEFLNSTRSKKRIARCHCGAAMEYQDTTFFYDGQSWEVKLPVCRKCHPAAMRVSAHEA
jgi:hypothetical protein